MGDTIVLSGKQASNVVWEKQSQFAQHIMERAKPLTDKISAVTSPALDGARSGKDIVLSRLHGGREVMISRFHDGHEFVTVRVNNLVIRLHLVEARDWSVNRLDQVKSSTVSVFMSAVQGVHKRIAESVAVSEVAVRCNSDVTRSDVAVAKL